MSLNSFVKLFTPKDRVFYSLFEEVADNLFTMSQVFRDALHEKDDAKKDTMLSALNALERKNDETTRRLFLELGKNFITPFDREDIHRLAGSLDDVADFIWASAKSIVNFDINEVNDTMRAFSEVILKTTDALRQALMGLRNMKDLKAITDACGKVNYFETEADKILDDALRQLFLHEKNPIELIKLKELYEDMEIVTNKCEDAANVIESIIVKYS
jgi:predicted phosphate transport protein (TIGR00153 family)